MKILPILIAIATSLLFASSVAVAESNQKQANEAAH
jgi:hypothetical protein